MMAFNLTFKTSRELSANLRESAIPILQPDFGVERKSFRRDQGIPQFFDENELAEIAI